MTPALPRHHLFRNTATSQLQYSWHHSNVLSLTESEHSLQQISPGSFSDIWQNLCFHFKTAEVNFKIDKYLFNPSIQWHKHVHLKSILHSHTFLLSSSCMDKSQRLHYPNPHKIWKKNICHWPGEGDKWEQSKSGLLVLILTEASCIRRNFIKCCFKDGGWNTPVTKVSVFICSVKWFSDSRNSWRFLFFLFLLWSLELQVKIQTLSLQYFRDNVTYLL